ncbi:hypothetical protein PVBG_06262 [Plasmodium vivax Brazil I]|uniref:Fam-l protein n=1 Tax=Plasmodium vivax (strain Brazil I) TaxID=1033975 RepID=A0A0J9T1J1_PLAV1|nr:hypothetical protein PVBG_06262 [Plasmodium vivax Brazil I]
MINKIKTLIFIRIYILILLSRKYNSINVLTSLGYNSHAKFNINGIFHILIPRSLAQRKVLNEVKNKKNYNKTISRLIKYEDANKYGKLNQNQLNNLEIYMKNLKYGYSKKKGIKKLNCFFEKEIFNEINRLKIFSRNVENDKKKFKLSFLIKRGISIIAFSLIPSLGLIFYILFGGTKKYLISWCTNLPVQPGAYCNCGSIIHASVETMVLLKEVNIIFSIILVVIVLSLAIYFIMKVLKYERLNSRKAK